MNERQIAGLCNWHQFIGDARECDEIATEHSGLRGHILVVCAKHKALEIPSDNFPLRVGG